MSGDALIDTVIIKSAGKDIRAGKSLRGEEGAIRPAADRFFNRFDSAVAVCRVGEVQNIFVPGEIVPHVAVLILNHHLRGSGAAGVEILHERREPHLAVLKGAAVMVTLVGSFQRSGCFLAQSR